MARIVISSHGTMGDFVPFIPLAKGLKGAATPCSWW